MSILIKGMDKPTDCGLCPFEDFGYCNVKGERNTSESGIDADCPLIEVADRKTENLSEIPTSLDEPQICSVNGRPYDCGNCEYHKCTADEPKMETKTETQNSNLTFERRTMLDCYNCKRYETEYECVECHYEPKDEPQTERSRR